MKATLVNVTFVEDEFVADTVMAGLDDPTVVEGNTLDVADSVSVGDAGATPVPDSGTVCGVPAASSLNVRFADRAPVALGAKLTVTLQAAPAASGPVHVLDVMGKSVGFAPVMLTVLKVVEAVPVFLALIVMPG